jgi:hypothetical protein
MDGAAIDEKTERVLPLSRAVCKRRCEGALNVSSYDYTAHLTQI